MEARASPGPRSSTPRTRRAPHPGTSADLSPPSSAWRMPTTSRVACSTSGAAPASTPSWLPPGDSRPPGSISPLLLSDRPVRRRPDARAQRPLRGLGRPGPAVARATVRHGARLWAVPSLRRRAPCAAGRRSGRGRRARRALLHAVFQRAGTRRLGSEASPQGRDPRLLRCRMAGRLDRGDEARDHLESRGSRRLAGSVHTRLTASQAVAARVVTGASCQRSSGRWETTDRPHPLELEGSLLTQEFDHRPGALSAAVHRLVIRIVHAGERTDLISADADERSRFDCRPIETQRSLHVRHNSANPRVIPDPAHPGPQSAPRAGAAYRLGGESCPRTRPSGRERSETT